MEAYYGNGDKQNEQKKNCPSGKIFPEIRHHREADLETQEGGRARYAKAEAGRKTKSRQKRGSAFRDCVSGGGRGTGR